MPAPSGAAAALIDLLELDRDGSVEFLLERTHLIVQYRAPSRRKAHSIPLALLERALNASDATLADCLDRLRKEIEAAQ